jgi:hypothetical protein
VNGGMADLEKKNKRIIIVSIVIILVVVGILVYPLFLDANEAEEGMTAIEGKVIADEVAKEWNDNATLYRVSVGEQSVPTGKAGLWQYYYRTFDKNFSADRQIVVYVYNETGVYYFPLALEANDTPIRNWEIDSDQAIDIALNNKTLSSYLTTNEIGRERTLSFMLTMENKSYPVWKISWDKEFDVSDMDDARIKINATSGKGR